MTSSCEFQRLKLLQIQIRHDSEAGSDEKNQEAASAARSRSNEKWF